MSMHLHDLVVTHGSTTLVDVGELRVERGRPVTIVGESGSGKSLLAHAVMGSLAPNLDVRGRLNADGTEYDLADRGNRRRAWGRVMSLLPQEPVLALDPTMRVREQVAEGAAAFAADRGSARRTAEGLLASLGLKHAGRAFPHTLSGGMAQRAAFAAATIGRAPVLIADEPSKGLDERARADLADLLQRHVEGGGILLTITHDLDLARELGGDVLVMKDASVVERGPVDRVLAEPTHSYTGRLLAAEPSRWSHPWMRSVPGPEQGAVLVAADGVAKSFGSQRLFSELTVSIRAGERLALSGPSGSGKTTLGNILLRLGSPDSGRVHHAAELGAGRVQKLYQDPALAFAAHVPLRVSIGDVLRRHRLEAARMEGLVAAVGLEPGLLARRPGQVSGGELQRLAIVRAMLLEPTLVFADEPTSRLDLVTQEQTVRCLMEQVDDLDCALVLVTHDEALARTVADRHLALPIEETVEATTV
jgi:peptide/nickel transport system ATP-binding protein